MFASEEIGDKKKSLFRENDPLTKVKTISLCQNRMGKRVTDIHLSSESAVSSYSERKLEFLVRKLRGHQELNKDTKKNLSCLSQRFPAEIFFPTENLSQLLYMNDDNDHNGSFD